MAELTLQWTASAERDITRLHIFLASVNPQVASRIVKQLISGAGQLSLHPHIGNSIDEFAPRDVRRLIIGDYELRYEIIDRTLYILRLWHTREDR